MRAAKEPRENTATADPYAPPRSELEAPEQGALSLYRRGLALIEITAILCLISNVLALYTTYVLGSSNTALTLGINLINGFLLLAMVTAQLAGLVYVARAVSGRRRVYALCVALLSLGVALAPGSFQLLGYDYVYAAIAKLFHYARWLAVIPVLRWKPPPTSAPALFGLPLASGLLAAGLTMKATELISSAVGSHMMWAFIVFIACHLSFLVVMGAHASWLRRALRDAA